MTRAYPENKIRCYLPYVGRGEISRFSLLINFPVLCLGHSSFLSSSGPILSQPPFLLLPDRGCCLAKTGYPDLVAQVVVLLPSCFRLFSPSSSRFCHVVHTLVDNATPSVQSMRVYERVSAALGVVIVRMSHAFCSVFYMDNKPLGTSSFSCCCNFGHSGTLFSSLR